MQRYEMQSKAKDIVIWTRQVNAIFIDMDQIGGILLRQHSETVSSVGKTNGANQAVDLNFNYVFAANLHMIDGRRAESLEARKQCK